MRRGTFVAIRHRVDGSLYFYKKTPFWSALRESIAIVLFIVIALLLLELAIFRSSATHAQESNRPVVNTVIASTGFGVSNETPHAELVDAADNRVLTETKTTPSLWPLLGRLTDGFGNRRNPFHRRSSEFHPGQDIAAPKGTPVRVTVDGTVVFASCKRGYGLVVIVDHGNKLSTLYGHLSQIETTVGTLIKRGDPIGLVGSTGRSTGSHLHYEVRVDQVPVNPLAYLPTSTPTVPAQSQKK